MSATLLYIYLVLSLQSLLPDASVDETTYSVQLTRNMQVSMGITINKMATHSITIFQIDQLLSLSLSPQNIVTLQIQNTLIDEIPFNLYTPYTLNLTLSPSNDHYTWQSVADVKTRTFSLKPDPLLFASSHSVTISNKNVQITNLVISSDVHGLNINAHEQMNRLFALGSNMSSTAAVSDEYEGIFGPNISESEEMLIIIGVVTVIVCMAICVAAALIRKHISRWQRRKDSEPSYSEVDGSTPIYYVDETNKNENAFEIPAGHKASIVSISAESMNKKYSMTHDGTHTNGHFATSTWETAPINECKETKDEGIRTKGEAHEDSIDAMDL